MKKHIKISTIVITAIAAMTLTRGCENNENNSDSRIKGGFSLIINDSITYNSNSIEFYDLSSHLIYLENGNSFAFSDHGKFSVLIGTDEIYSGNMHPRFSSSIPVGPYIPCSPTFYNDYIIPVGFNQFVDNKKSSNDDLRNDPRIIETLKKYNQLKKGLSSKILSIQKIFGNSIKITLELNNLDSENLLILDPDKMGAELFHYYTNGLILKDAQNNTYSHNLTIEKPESNDLWKRDWLSAITGHQAKTISIVYNDFDFLPKGEYTAKFNFPGLRSQVEKNELYQHNGRIWLGKLNISKTINIE